MTLTRTLDRSARISRWILGLGAALATLGCVPDPPRADPPEVEVSGGELPEYEYDAAELEEEEPDRLALELPESQDFEDAERFLTQ